jgi:tetraacyldisaccharide 4'-kinase
MKLFRYLAFPFVPIYFLVTWCINKAYNVGFFKSKTYNFPVICVGNLSVGGTGKSPMVSYLINLLKDEKQTATLSRGYGRATKGFVLAKNGFTHKDLGDESFQYYQNFGNDITVAVCEDRQNGISKLTDLQPKPEVIVLDDAYQHRKVKAGFNVLLSTYSNLFTDDLMLPTGNLREPKSGYKRANAIVVTKCSTTITDDSKKQIVSKINPLEHQSVYFSSIVYSNSVKSAKLEQDLESLKNFSLVTGIANAKPLVIYLKNKGLSFEHLEYADHYNFTQKDINVLSELELILTTEKDYMRLQFEPKLKDKLYYLPIEIEIDNALSFNKQVLDFVKTN